MLRSPSGHLRIAIPALALLTAFGAGCIEQRRPRKDKAAAAAAGEPGAPAAEVDDTLSHLVTGERWRVPVAASDPAKGAAEPLVTIVEFSDFQCPACKSLVPNLEQAFAAHKDDVRIVFKQFPLAMHAQAEPAARAALAADRQGKFWPMHDLLFANQQALQDADLEGYAKQIGIDAAKFKADYADPEIARRVKLERNAGNAVKISSTPSFFINGRLIKGAVPAEQISATIEEEIALARRLMAAGSQRSEIYARILKAATLGEEPAPVVANAEPEHKRGEASRIPNYAVATGEGRPSRGPEDALVTIIEFNDFTCDDCKKVPALLQRVLDKYPRDVRLVYRHAPTDDSKARDASRFAEAAHAQGKFWEVAEKLLAGTDGDFKSMMAAARDAGADTQLLLGAIQSKGTAEAISADMAALDAFRGAAPAPIVFVNGRYLDGAMTFAEIDALVAEEKAKAEKFIADTKTPRNKDLYEAMRTKGNDGKGWRGLKRADAAGDGATAAAGAKVDVSTEGLPVKGNAKTAKVEIVECTDFDCPFCQRSLATLAQIEETYGDKVAVYFRHNPLPMHQNAEPAHRAAIAAGEQGKFWEMHDKLFADKQSRSDAQLEAFAKDLGLDVDKWRKSFAAPETAAIVQRDLAECRKLGVSGVPAFFVNGESVRGAQPFEAFKPIIDRALAAG